MTSVIVVEDLAGEAVLGRGGHAIHVLQFLEGLRRLGHDVLFVEFLAGPPRPAQTEYWNQLFGRWWPSERAALLSAEDGRTFLGATGEAVARHAERAQAVIGLSATYRADPWPVIGDIRPRVLIDTDPAYTHLWAADDSPANIWGEHDVHFTVGLNVGTNRCSIPTSGLEWRPVPNWVLPDWWPVSRRISRDRFTTVGAWRDYGYLEFEGRLLGPKVEEFEHFMTLPSLAGEAVELTLAIDPEDPDLERLRSHGWVVQDAGLVSTAERFRDYVTGSLAEFSCAKGGYVGTHSGWFSDRSAAYLAAGRPVVAQATGFEDVLPVGRGLFAVRSADEAVDALRAVRRDYLSHSRAARDIAVRHLDAQRVIGRVLEEAGLPSHGAAGSPGGARCR